MHYKLVLVAFGILIVLANCRDCSGNTGLVLKSTLGMSHTDIITFDDQGFIESFLWESSKDEDLILNANGTTVTLSGSGCVIGSGSYFSNINPENWKGSNPWIDSEDLPGFFMSLETDATECIMTFNPPINSFVANTNSFDGATCSFFIFDAAGEQIDCANDCPINAGENNYAYRGFYASVPIGKIIWANAYTAVDNIFYELYCPDGNYNATLGICDYCGSNPCDPIATCTNEPPSFSCLCAEGFQGDGIGPGGCQPIPPEASPIAEEPVSEPTSAGQPNAAAPTATPTAAPKSTPVAKASSSSQIIASASVLIAAVALI